MFMDSLEGIYFLRRSLFLPGELASLMGPEMAREGLQRLGGKPPGMTDAKARDSTSAVGLLHSTQYLRNQLLRDSDWASMGHSLELRTPLVDAKLLATLGHSVSNFAGGVGKTLLANSPIQSLPDAVINQPKTGFSLPMAKWLTDATDNRAWVDEPLLNARGTPWARRWAKVVVDSMTGCA